MARAKRDAKRWSNVEWPAHGEFYCCLSMLLLGPLHPEVLVHPLDNVVLQPDDGERSDGDLLEELTRRNPWIDGAELKPTQSKTSEIRRKRGAVVSLAIILCFMALAVHKAFSNNLSRSSAICWGLVISGRKWE